MDKKIWLTSDLHFCHNKPFIYEPRGFNSVEEMNKTIIKNWNSIVNSEDTVYVLGDLMLNNNEEGLRCLSELNGRIKVILGNHDGRKRAKLYESLTNVEVLGYADILKYRGYHFYLSHYPTLTSNYDEDKPLKARIINLCGHSHTSDRFVDNCNGLIYHIELDAHNNKPILLDDIIEDIKEQERWL